MMTECHHIRVEGRVQGVGFRPFVYQLARELSLDGWVHNCGGCVEIAIQGKSPQLQYFLQQLSDRKPAQAQINRLQCHPVTWRLEQPGFEIRHSNSETQVTCGDIAVDLAPCAACLQELFDPDNRRYAYPFSHCTDCGPRYSVIQGLPYDRDNTTLQAFPLCSQCQAEYRNPYDRRFHAETIACPDCGPQLQLLTPTGQPLAHASEALELAANAIVRGQIVAMKSVGGFQLLADAGNSKALATLRQRKRRPTKPFALLCSDISQVHRYGDLSPLEQQLLCSPQRPIVLLAKKRHKATIDIVDDVATGVPCWGIMLPCSPLHSLLMARLKRPLVATSGNLAGEPICIDDKDAVERLGRLADCVLTHNRPIARQLDDAIIRVINQQPCVLRLGRGFAPLSLPLPPAGSNADSIKDAAPPAMLATGGQVKNSLALYAAGRVHVSQHIGDLHSRQALAVFEQTADDLCRFYQVAPRIIVHDQHPDYAATQWARARSQRYNIRSLEVQHHVAHFFSCMAEHGYRGPALGICWDGSGYSHDGVIRGGESLCWDGAQSVTPLASLRAFPLPGGEQAIREPRRQAAALLYALLGEVAFGVCPSLWQQFSVSERRNLQRMLERGLNTPMCSSVGRLFDAVAALLGLAPRSQFEGQAAMALEACANTSAVQWQLPFALTKAPAAPATWILDWHPTLMALIEAIGCNTPTADVAAAFHNTLAQMIVEISHKAPDVPIFLSGGVFQNKRLTETATGLLRSRASIRSHPPVWTHQQVPPNDAGLSLGQLYFAQACAQPVDELNSVAKESANVSGHTRKN